jgi:hypothetical protein
VKDTDGDIDYRSGWVRVLNVGDRRCTVNTANDVDDGATSCTGPFGADGKLSLSEAVRLSNATPQLEAIIFSTTMTITSAGIYDLDADVDIYAQPGVILVGKTLRVRNNNTNITIFGLEMSNQTARFDITGSGDNVQLHDVYMHDMPGIQVSRAALTLEQIRMAACVGGPCINKASANAGSITLSYSELRNSPGQVAVNIADCPGAGTVLDMFSNTIAGGFSFGVATSCNGPMLVRENTFDQVQTGVAYQGGTGHVLVDNIFTSNSVSAATCGTATFTTRSHHQLFGNASNGCVNGDPNTLTTDPRFAFESAGDLRLAFGSPAIDSALDTGLDVCFGFPGNFEGAGPDRGGRESY